MSLNKATILITGAGGGLGSTAALAAARQGAQIILLDKNIPKLEKVYDAIVDQGSPQPAIYPFDLAGATELQYQELANIVSKTYGSLQGLLHSAVELSAFTPLEIHQTKDWGHTLNVNLNAPFLLTRVLLPLMHQSKRASIIFTGDSFVAAPRAYSGAYGVSKIALQGLAKILAEELESADKIKVNTLIPGPVDSPLRHKLFPAEDKEQLPNMDSLAAVYCYLLDAENLTINGQVVEANTFDLDNLPHLDVE